MIAQHRAVVPWTAAVCPPAIRRKAASRPILVAASMLLGLAAGCQVPDVRDAQPLGWKDQQGQPDMHVDRMLTAWKNVTVHQPGKPSMRGFGGRLYLYNRDGQPIEATGHLVVYVYDDQVRQDRPVRRYVFTPEQLQEHFSTSSLGPSYSIWLPWDEQGGPRKDLVLVPTFVPESGSVVVAEAIKQRLPGDLPPGAKAPSIAAAPPPAVQSAAYRPNSQAASPSTDPPAGLPREAARSGLPGEQPAGLRETTIPMTPNVRWQAAQAVDQPTGREEDDRGGARRTGAPAAQPQPQLWWPAGVPMGGRPFAPPTGIYRSPHAFPAPAGPAVWPTTAAGGTTDQPAADGGDAVASGETPASGRAAGQPPALFASPARSGPTRWPAGPALPPSAAAGTRP